MIKVKYRLKEYRLKNKLTQVEIASKLSCTQRAYSRYENHERSIPIEYLVLLSRIYNVTIDDLLDIEEN